MTTTEDEHILRDFVHTVDVLTATALAEHERGLRLAASTPPPRRHYVRLATGAAMALAVIAGTYGGYEFSRWQPSEDSEAQFRRKTTLEVQRQADIAAAAKRKVDEEAQAKAFAAAAAKRQQDEARLAEEREPSRPQQRAQPRAPSYSSGAGGGSVSGGSALPK